MATAKRHFTMCHRSYHVNYPEGRTLRAGKAGELRAALRNTQKATEASFRATQFLIKKKKTSDGEDVKEAMMLIARNLLEDEKYGTKQATAARRVWAMSGNLVDQMDRDLARWSASTSLTSRWTGFDDFSTKEEHLTLQTTGGEMTSNINTISSLNCSHSLVGFPFRWRVITFGWSNVLPH